MDREPRAPTECKQPWLIRCSRPPHSHAWRRVVSLSSFADEMEAIALANDNQYALGAGVWTRDLKRAHRVMDSLRAGVIWANAHHRNAPDAPWGGFGASGIGRENGLDAHREYTASATMIVRTAESKEDWFAQNAAGARYG